MFGLTTWDLPRITSYQEAVTHFDSVKGWRGEPDHYPRPISSESRARSRNKQMRRLADGSIAFMLYRTDVVTWMPDGRVKIEPWPSQSTNRFADRFLPYGVFADFENTLGSCLVFAAPSPRRWFRIDSNEPHYAILRHNPQANAGWEFDPETPPAPFTHFRLDRKALNAAIKDTAYHVFAAWLRITAKLDPALLANPTTLWLPPLPAKRYLELLAGFGDAWRELAAAHRSFDECLNKTRLAVVQTGGCLRVESKDYLTSWRELAAVNRARRKYGAYT